MPGKVTIFVQCTSCEEIHAIKLNQKDLDAWRLGGIKIQHAFPYLKASERELLLSGICGKCFDNMCNEEEY